MSDKGSIRIIVEKKGGGHGGHQGGAWEVAYADFVPTGAGIDVARVREVRGHADRSLRVPTMPSRPRTGGCRSSSRSPIRSR